MRKSNPSLKIFLLTAIFVVFILLCGSCSEKAVTTSSFTSVKWTIIGPYDEPEQGTCTLYFKDILATHGTESGLSDSGLPKNIGKVSKIQAENNLVDFGMKFPGKNYAMAYATLEFEGDGQEHFFRMGSDDGLRVWINGKLVVDEHAHRSINPNSNSFRTILKKGTNRILVKVCQGTGEWGFTFRETTRQEHEAFLTETSQIALTLSTENRFLGEADNISFSIFANPAPLVDVPLSYAVEDSEGKTIAMGTTLAGELISADIPSDCIGELYITAVPEAVNPTKA